MPSERIEPWGVIFDWDGVVIDSHQQHEESWSVMAAEAGHALPTGFFKKSFGMRNEAIFNDIFQWSRDPEQNAHWAARKEEIYRELVARDGIDLLPGVTELFRSLKDKGIPRAVGSSTPKANIIFLLDLLGLVDFFQYVVTGEDVSQGKPHPEVFQRAAQGLGLPAQRCVVIEDAHVGIEAGLSAGARVLALATTHPIHSLNRAHAARVNLSGVRWQDLAEMIGQE